MVQHFSIDPRLIAMTAAHGLTSLVLVVVATTASAQTTPVSVVHEYVPSVSVTAGQVEIPSNLKISSMYRELVKTILSQSPTFRRQILRIAGAHELTVHLHMTAPLWPRDVRATTQFVRAGNGLLAANVEIAPLNNDVELIAHELEHVIEQLDDVDLPARARQAKSGVHATTDGGVLFETIRATRIGQQVAREVR
jgi:predicted ATP-grasp superfamily ATP-dependent carboligase